MSVEWFVVFVVVLATLSPALTEICPEATGFDDVHDALQAARMVYDKNLVVSLPVPYTKYKIKQIYQVESENDPIDDGNGLKVLFADKDEDFTTIVAIKGADGPYPLRLNLYNKIKRFEGVSVKFKNNETSIHAYFWKMFQLIINNILSRLQDQSRKYIITGHSLGGALASILALYMKTHEGRMWENPSSCLITFGQPRVGDIRYAKLHDEHINPLRKFRFVNDLDPAPHIPFWPEAVHHSREIWMTTATMSKERYWKVCGEMEPLKGSNMWVQKPEVMDHDIRGYRDFITHPPSVFLDKYYGRHPRWVEAMEKSCNDTSSSASKMSPEEAIQQTFQKKDRPVNITASATGS